MNTQAIKLDLSKRASVAPIVAIRQGDVNGTVLEVSVFDNGEEADLDGLDVNLCVLLPDREHSYVCAGTASGNTATFTVDETYAAAYTGRTDTAYVEIVGSGFTCSTQAFGLAVEESARTE